MPQKNMEQSAHLVTGAEGEEQAAKFLQGQGLRIIERNWRPAAHFGPRAGRLELDMVAQGREGLVFVEVKSRRSAPGAAYSPMDSFTPAKRELFLKAATLYLEEKQAWGKPCRLDLICVVFNTDKSISVEQHKNVLSFESQGRAAVGSRNAPWQPW